jgi:nicotinate-nucleotide--dimethylbenzimidazole phosphoribosyltransferase
MGGKAVVVFAADHGVTAEGVSAYPQEVTAQRVLNFLHGGAAINALSRQAGAVVHVVDIGVASELPVLPGLTVRSVRRGTANIARAVLARVA